MFLGICLILIARSHCIMNWTLWAEFVIATGNDMNRLEQIQCHTARSSHPFHRFTWGEILIPPLINQMQFGWTIGSKLRWGLIHIEVQVFNACFRCFNRLASIVLFGASGVMWCDEYLQETGRVCRVSPQKKESTCEPSFWSSTITTLQDVWNSQYLVEVGGKL